MAALKHGGQLAKIATQYNIERSRWLDLSTGIAPYHYPINDIPLSLYQQLPQIDDELLCAARDYYGHQSVLATNGSQAIIKLLPELWKEFGKVSSPASRTVYLPKHGYKEHQQAWQQAQFTLCLYDDELPPLSELTPHCVLVIINPNNPTGKLFTQPELVVYQNHIASLDGLLVIDEAFMDVVTPCQTMASSINDAHLIILRSFGKFFGLAGIRIGFVLANDNWITRLKDAIGPWQVNGPAQHIAAQALADKDWHQQQRQCLSEDCKAMKSLLQRRLNSAYTCTLIQTDLFSTITFHEPKIAPALFHALCLQGIYVRLCDDNTSLRFGIATPSQQRTLDTALSKAIDSLTP